MQLILVRALKLRKVKE